MKRVCAALLALSLLTGCRGMSQTLEPDPSDEAMTLEGVEPAYREAAMVYDWFDLCSLPSTDEGVELEGTTYYPVSYEELETYADLEEKVYSLFSPALAEEILTGSQNYRDIDGKLYTAQGARGSNLDLYGTTVQVSQQDPDHFTVELLSWTDSMAIPGGYQAPELWFGYSRQALTFERLEEGFRFTSFCSSDALDLEADTVCTFPNPLDLEHTDYAAFDDWQLLCYLVHADGAYAEAPSDELLMRFLDRPQDILAQLALLYQSPFFDDPAYPQLQELAIHPAYGASSFLYPDEQPDFLAALDLCQPETLAQQEVLDLMRSEFTALTAYTQPYDSDREFGLLVPGEELILTLGDQEGAFPWGFQLEGTPVELRTTDELGTVYTVDCGTVRLVYGVKNGIETLYRMETSVSPEEAEGFYCTPRGLYCGYAQEDLQRIYLHARKLPGFESPDYDSCYLYEVSPRRISFYIKDGAVAKLEIQQLTDHTED